MTEYDSAKLLVEAYEFPREKVVAEALSDRFRRSAGRQNFTIGIDMSDAETGKKYNYLVGIVPGDSTLSTVHVSEINTIMETDPFTISTNGSIRRSQYDGQLNDDSGDTFSRNSVEGAYQLEVKGRTDGKDWNVNIFAFKSGHAYAANQSRGRSRPEYVKYELTDGTATELAGLLKEDADALGFDEYQAVEFVIDFVQALPYVTDDVSKGFDDYTKFIMETVPEMGGDCEDAAILLASVLEAKPFNYDMILIQPPGHMGAGIYQTDPPGWYWELDGRKYSYIEATGRGWGIGDLPEEYQGSSAELHQV